MEKNISKAKVLVCDDSMMVRNKMKKLLTAYGFTQIFEAPGSGRGDYAD